MKNNKHWIELDGSRGEGGGQVLRTALTLSMITGIPFRIGHIRAGRQKPGLLRQHLTAVNAAAALCGAEVAGASLGSTVLSFEPGPIRGGDYRFAIGTAGSTTLVLQTVMPALWFADEASSVIVSGGTHNSAAPPADFLIRSWLPLVRRMGVRMDIELLRHGFYPAGGGAVKARIEPAAGLQPLHLLDRGACLGIEAHAVVAGVPAGVAQREIDRARSTFPLLTSSVRSLPAREGPGNVFLLQVDHAEVSEVFAGFGEKGLAAETVADQALREARRYLDSGAAAGEHLADQLLLPLALAGAGSFTTCTLSGHLRTNLEVISLFLPVEAETEAWGEGAWKVVMQ